MALFAITVAPSPGAQQKRYDELPSWAQALIDKPILWELVIPCIPAVAGILLWFIWLMGGPFWYPLITIFGITATVVYYAFAFEAIGENEEGEPQFGLLEVFKLRLPIVFDEGIALKIPGISRIVRRSKEQFDDDLEIPRTKCRLEPASTAGHTTFFDAVAHALNTPSPPDIGSGGDVQTSLGLTFERDWRNGWAVLEYDNVGETEGFLKIARDIIQEDLQEVGRRLTWLQASFATDLIGVHMITRMTGMAGLNGENVLANPTPESVTAFLDYVRENGVSYINGLGVNIRRMQIKSIEPIGKLADAAEAAAVQKMRRIGLLENVDALGDAVERLRQRLNDGSLTHKDLVNIIQVDEDGSRVSKQIQEFQIDDVDKIAGVLVNLLGGKSA